MAYKTASLETAKVMIKNFKELSEEIQELEKDKKDKKKQDQAKKLQKELDAKGKKIDDVLVKILGDTRKEFLTHAAKVDKCLGEAVLKVKALTGGVKTFKTKPDNNLFLELAKVPRELEALVKEAKDDNDDFGSSWFELRGVKWTSEGLDEKYNKRFYQQRFELMGDAKGVRAKIDQMDNLQKQAVILVNELRAMYTSGQQDQAGIEEDAKDLLAKITKIHKDYDDKTYVSGAIERTRSALATPGELDDRFLSNVRSRTQDMISIHKELKGQHSLLKKEVDQLNKMAKNPTEKAQKDIAKCEELVGEFPGFITKASDAAKAYADIFKEAAALIKQNQKKK